LTNTSQVRILGPGAKDCNEAEQSKGQRSTVWSPFEYLWSISPVVALSESSARPHYFHVAAGGGAVRLNGCVSVRETPPLGRRAGVADAVLFRSDPKQPVAARMARR